VKQFSGTNDVFNLNIYVGLFLVKPAEKCKFRGCSIKRVGEGPQDLASIRQLKDENYTLAVQSLNRTEPIEFTFTCQLDGSTIEVHGPSLRLQVVADCANSRSYVPQDLTPLGLSYSFKINEANIDAPATMRYEQVLADFIRRPNSCTFRECYMFNEIVQLRNQFAAVTYTNLTYDFNASDPYYDPNTFTFDFRTRRGYRKANNTVRCIPEATSEFFVETGAFSAETEVNCSLVNQYSAPEKNIGPLRFYLFDGENNKATYYISPEAFLSRPVQECEYRACSLYENGGTPTYIEAT